MAASIDPHLDRLLSPSAEGVIDAVLTLDGTILRAQGVEPEDAGAVERLLTSAAGAKPASARYFPRLGVLRVSAAARDLRRLLTAPFVRTAACADTFAAGPAARGRGKPGDQATGR